MRTAHPHRPPHGFTLVELVIAIGATSIVIAAAMALMISQQTAYRAGSEDRSLQDAGRIALSAITRSLRTAGYGVDAGYALDFGQTDAVPQSGLQGGQSLGALSAHACDTAVDCRDRIDAPDEIVFYARDPVFSRRAKAGSVTTTGLTLVGRMEEPLREGQVLQVMCLTGEQIRAYVTVGATVPPAVNVPESDTTDVPVSLVDGQTIADHPAFPFQNGQLSNGCFAADVIVAKVDRYRFHVVGFKEDGTAVDPAAGDDLQQAGVRPYLMLEQGLKENDAVIDRPVAPDVEDLQFSYFYPPAAAGAAHRVVGADPGTLASEEAFPMALVQPPAVTDALTAESRGTGSPVNIQGVRISLVVRTADPDLKYAQPEHRRIPPTPLSDREDPDLHDPLGNRESYEGVPMYRRLRLDTTLLLPNLRATAVIYCVTDPTGATAGANFGGC